MNAEMILKMPILPALCAHRVSALRHSAMNIDTDNQLTGAVIGAAIDVHRQLGPQLDEIAYEEALSRRLTALGTKPDGSGFNI